MQQDINEQARADNQTPTTDCNGNEVNSKARNFTIRFSEKELLCLQLVALEQRTSVAEVVRARLSPVFAHNRSGQPEESVQSNHSS